MTLPRHLMATGFSFERMLELEPIEARKYYIENLFVPAAYEILSAATTDALVSLFIQGGPARPILARINQSAGLADNNWPQMGTEQVHIQHFERITGRKLDADLQATAIKHAFDKLVPGGQLPELRMLPIIATLALDHASEKLTLHLLTTKPDNTRLTHTLQTGWTLPSSINVSGVATGYRGYNRKTGAWVGLCEPDDPDCCEECKKIYRSKWSESAFDAGL